MCALLDGIFKQRSAPAVPAIWTRQTRKQVKVGAIPWPWLPVSRLCQCANLQPATLLSCPALPASNSRVWKCQQHAPLKTNQPPSHIKHPEVKTSLTFQPITPRSYSLPPAMPTWWPIQAQTHKKNSSKQGNGLIWAHRTEETICMPTLCFSSLDTAGGIWKSVVCE